MENILRAGRAGTVARVNVSAGATLALDEVILELA
jgi:biotin carboxyl carrier protein